MQSSPVPATPGGADTKNLASSSPTAATQTKKPGPMTLFGSDDDEEEEEEDEDDDGGIFGSRMKGDDADDSDDDDEERFRIKPQYEGEAGQKVSGYRWKMFIIMLATMKMPHDFHMLLTIKAN